MEIYTEKDGGVIFRKYSPMGDLQDMAGQICDAIGSNLGRIAAVTDQDSIIALQDRGRFLVFTHLDRGPSPVLLRCY